MRLKQECYIREDNNKGRKKHVKVTADNRKIKYLLTSFLFTKNSFSNEHKTSTFLGIVGDFDHGVDKILFFFGPIRRC